MKIKSNKIFGAVMAAVLAVLIAGTVPAVASGVRDTNGNGIIYGGVYSIRELNEKLDGGTGQPNESSSELKQVFSANGVYQKDFGQLTDGVVTKSGDVIVNGRVVATGVTTMGRHYIPGSVRDTRFSFPIYLRHPSVSFLSDRLDAYVSINSDGSYAYAIIKACGNIVQGPGVKVKPKPVLRKLTIRKFEDKNGNQKKDSNESFLSGWSFRVTGPNGYSKTVTTGSNGSVVLTGLVDSGRYTVSEIVQSGWRVTNGQTRTINLNVDTEQWFGNQRVPKIVTPKPNPTPVPTPTPQPTPKPTPVVATATTSLPTSGPVEAAAGALGTVSIAGAAAAWKKSKLALLKSLKKF